MKLISLTQGQFAQVDDADFEALSKFNWRALKRNTYYAFRRIILEDGRISVISMHRHLMGFKHGDKRIVDHIDRNGLNCQRNNLREANRSQNGANRRSAQNSSSAFLGVTMVKKKLKSRIATYWQADIRINKKQKCLGTFATEIIAAKAYDSAAKEHHGEFAKLNFK